jgi:hypothetical protein
MFIADRNEDGNKQDGKGLSCHCGYTYFYDIKVTESNNSSNWSSANENLLEPA